MNIFWKTTAGVLISLILILSLGKQEKDIACLLSIAVCCMTGMAAIQLLEPVVDFLYEIQTYAGLDESIFRSVLRMVGIGLISELIAMICTDAGHSSLGKDIQIMGSAVILYLSVPIFENVIGLIQKIMGGL